MDTDKGKGRDRGFDILDEDAERRGPKPGDSNGEAAEQRELERIEREISNNWEKLKRAEGQSSLLGQQPRLFMGGL